MGVKSFDVTTFTKANIIDPKNVSYQDSVDIINDELHKARKSFIKIGWYLKHINEANMYKEDGYANINDFAHDKFKISQSTTTRLIGLCCQFSVGHDSPELDEKYLDYNISQLFEMLPMLQEQREKITPDMTIRQIRDIKNEDKEQSVDENDPEKDIPGQTSIEKDFPEYMPDDISVEPAPEQENEYATSHKKAEGYDEADDAIEDKNDVQLISKIPDRCMTGWSKYPDFCSCCGKNGAQCCVQCPKEYYDNCNVRCGWVKEPYKPDKTDTEPAEVYVASNQLLNNDQTIIDGEYKEISSLNNLEEKESVSDEEERHLRNEIEHLAEDVRKIIWSWNAVKKMPHGAREDIIVAKENALKLTDAIEKLLNMLK